MVSIFSKLNPRRWWLWSRHRKAIENHALELLPRPYDLGAILLEARTGRSIPSPREGMVYRERNPQSQGAADSQSSKNGGRYIAGGEALALYGVDVAQKMMAIDSHVYGAMSRLAQAQVDNLSDLSAQFQVWDHSAWSGLSDGALSKFAGHVGEVHAATHLNEIGVSVLWPDASNQAGWDLLVGGHEVNVKTIADAAALHQHFDRYPDIAALIPGDAVNIPVGAFHLYPGGSVAALDNYLSTHEHHAVIVDHSLSHADVVRQAADASDAALGSGSIVDAHLPWVTLATAGWREIKLLRDAQTDVRAAAKNLSIDVAGRGGGAAVGAKAGALVGGLLGPIGAAVGVVIGGVGGAIAGGAVADSIKRKPLEKAVRDYDSAEADYRNQSFTLNGRAKDRYLKVRASEQQLLRSSARAVLGELDNGFQALSKWRSSVEQLPKEGAEGFFANARCQLATCRQELLVELKRVGLVDRMLWISPHTLSLEYSIAELERAIALLSKVEAKPDSVSQSELFALLARFGVAETVVRVVVNSIEDERRRRESAYRQRIKRLELDLADGRVQAFRRLAQTVAASIAHLQREIRPFVERAANASETVRFEMGKLGIR